MTTNRAKSKKVVNISDKLSLAASGSLSSPLAGSSSLVKVPSKRHTWVSPSVVSTTLKSPKIFNNKPVNKLVFPALTTSTITSTTTTSQMAMKVKNSKKQQQAVTTAMVTLNPFVVPDEIFGKISTAAASPLLDMNGNSSSTSPKMGQDQLLAVLPDVVLSGRLLPIPVAKQSINPDDLKNWTDQMEMESTVSPPVSGAADGGAWENVNSCQRFSGWVASNLVLGATFKIKMALLVLRDVVKLFCMEFASQECLNGVTKVAIRNEVFLTTLKITWSSGVASVFFPSLSVALHDVPLGTSSDDIKTAFGIFGVITSVKLKPVGLWQYAVVNFKDIFSAAAALSNWSVLVRKDSARIFPIANQKEIISSRDTFKAKLVNLLFGCTAFEINDLVSQVGGCMCFIPRFPESYQCQCFAVVTFDSLEILNETPGCCRCYRCQDLGHLAMNCKKLPPPTPKLYFNTSSGPKIFKPSFAGSKSYAKAAAFVVPPGAAAADMNLDLGGSPKTTPPIVPVIPFVPKSAVESWLASLESHLSELSVLIKSLVESVGALVVLITKLLSILTAVDVSVKECVDGLAKQNKGLAAVVSIMQRSITHLEKRCEQAGLEDGSDIDDMVDDDNDDDVMMHLWEVQPSSIKSSPDQTAKWMSNMVKNSHELVSIMSKMYELEMFDTLSNKDQFSRQFQDFWNWFLNKHSAKTYTAYTTYYFDQAYFEDDFEERNNSINQLLYSAIFEQQPSDFEYLNHQIHIWNAAHQSTKTPLETEEESYQTTPVFDLFSSELKHSTQTVTPEPMAQNPLQQNILIALQDIQTALGRRNNTPLLLF
ncbi:hypothetical protein G9A89_018652 [Geosiphon pyriformis]|nr:hypothetical protein G9A89_018652 [Geosiphon pyriformis]